MCEEVNTAMHFRWCQLVVMRQLSSCSWRRTQMSMHREECMAMCFRQHWLVVTRQSSGCSWRRNMDINVQGVGDSALYVASYGSHTAVIWMLLEKDVDVNAQGGSYGNTYWLVVMRQPSGCSWRRTWMSMCRESMAPCSRCAPFRAAILFCDAMPSSVMPTSPYILVYYPSTT